ncbi:MAG: protein jag [Patescibacteria group bacterium]
MAVKKQKKTIKSGRKNKKPALKSDKNKTSLVKEITEDLLKLMGTKASAKVSEDKEAEAVVVDLETEEEAGLLIGNRGETLDSLQAIIGMIYRQKKGEWQRVILNVADWRKRQEERLQELADQAAERAKETGLPQSLYNLTPAQRRVVHLALSEDKDIETESQGEGRDRYLIIHPRKRTK